MYTGNALGLYINANRKVTDWTTLAADVDVVFIRAAYTPKTRVVNGKPYFDKDGAAVIPQWLAEDTDFRLNYTNARMAGARIMVVIEANIAYDLDNDFNRSDQAKRIREILSGSGDYSGDGIVVQLTMNQWWANSRVTTIPGGNFGKAVRSLLLGLTQEFGRNKTIFVWSNAATLKADFALDAERYDYATVFANLFDGFNGGEATYPLGMTYIYKDPVKKILIDGWLINATYDSLYAMRDALPLLWVDEINNNLRVGSYTGWLSRPNHGFWAVYGGFLPYIKTASGGATYSEMILFDCSYEDLLSWMGWPGEPEPEPEPKPTPIEKPYTLVLKRAGGLYYTGSKLLYNGIELKVSALTVDIRNDQEILVIEVPAHYVHIQAPDEQQEDIQR